MSDPNSFAWHQRIKAAFPLSYESVLKETVEQQIEQLQCFDTMIESGHQVSSYLVDSLVFGRQEDTLPTRIQIPWQKDLLLIMESTNVKLFDMSTASVVSTLELAPFEAHFQVYIDIKGMLVIIY